MIPDQYYMISFFISITFIVIIGMVPSLKYKSLASFPDANLVFGTLLLLVIPILFIGLRNPFASWRYLGDTHAYTLIYQRLQTDPLWSPSKDFGFYAFMKFFSGFIDVRGFFFICSLIYVLPVYFGFRNWFGKYAYFALVIHVSSMSFWPFGVNGLRNGLAASIFLAGLTFYHKKWIMIALIAISITFHTSMLLPAFAIVCIQFFNNTKWLLRIWAASIPISFLIGRTIQNYIKFFISSTLGSYDARASFGGSAEAYQHFAPSVYRFDFVFYSGLVIGLGYYFIYKRNFKHSFYTKLFNIYLIANSIWLYFMYFPYTNRIAYLSWFLIPALAIYPIIFATNIKNQSYFMASAVGVSLFFAWIIAFI